MLEVCLQSIERQTFTNYRLIVVDNGSTDESPQKIRKNFPQITLICFSENKGFSKAVNAGILASEAEWVFLLNNDVELAEDCLKQLAKFIDNIEGYDSIALKMLSFHNRAVLDGAGDSVLRGGAGYRLGTMERDSEKYNISREVFGACAGAAVYSRNFFRKAGLFDEDFFAYLEDVDLNLRARRLGMKCFYVPEAVVYHVGSASTGSRINSFTVSQSTRNSLLVVLKNYPFFLFLRLLPVILIYQFFWFLFVLKKGKFISYLKGVFGAFCLFPKMVTKRKEILENKGNIDSGKFCKLLQEAEYEVVRSIMSRRDAEGKGNGLLKIYAVLFL